MAAFLALRGAPSLHFPDRASRHRTPTLLTLRTPFAARAEEIDLLFYERSKVAEALRDRETRKAVRLQSAHRGRAVRLEVEEWNAMALVIERCTRGHLGRQQARRLRIGRDTRRQRSFFDALATTVQKRFRAYHARKYRHNFYARQAYVASVRPKGPQPRASLPQRPPHPSHRPPPPHMQVLRKGDMVREDLRTRMDEQVRDALATQETQARQRGQESEERPLGGAAARQLSSPAAEQPGLLGQSVLLPPRCWVAPRTQEARGGGGEPLSSPRGGYSGGYSGGYCGGCCGGYRGGAVPQSAHAPQLCHRRCAPHRWRPVRLRRGVQSARLGLMPDALCVPCHPGAWALPSHCRYIAVTVPLRCHPGARARQHSLQAAPPPALHRCLRGHL